MVNDVLVDVSRCFKITLQYEQQCLGDDVGDIVIPSYAFSLPCYYYYLLFLITMSVRRRYKVL